MMLKSVNRPESIVLFILLLWVTIDLWTRPLRFTDEVLPKHWNTLTVYLYPLLFLLFYLVSRPVYVPFQARSHRFITVSLSYLTIHVLFFFFRPATDSLFSLLYLLTTWLFLLIVLSLSTSLFTHWHQLLFLILFYQALFLASYALLVSFGQVYIPIDNLQWFRIGPLALPQLYVGEQGSFLRLASLTNNPNAFAAWLVPGGLIAWVHLLDSLAHRSWRRLAGYGCSFVLIASGLLASGSQTGIYSFFLLALLTTILIAPTRRLRSMVSTAYIMGLIILTGALSFQTGLFTRLVSLNGRLDLWQAGLAASADRFWFGHGFGASATGLKEQLGEETLYTFHSTPIVFLYEFGLIGLLLYIVCFSFILIRLVRDYRFDDLQSVTLLLIGFWLFLAQFTESLLTRPSGFYFIWLSLLAYATLRRDTPTDSTHT
ncbi:O-antigen ligase family protein [Exiguobacterium sp. s193]|uniref:O-antigen ligase family protein n=1 Tax=Exiguobacterium sp. s193 TaxID=2751207 RepID=UPI00203727FE|nr:O-antigen ligase family protein [Exiguobacterium sp. s193]